MMWKETVKTVLNFCFFYLIYWILPYISFERISSYATLEVKSMFQSDETKKKDLKFVKHYTTKPSGREYAQKVDVIGLANLCYLLHEVPSSKISQSDRKKLEYLVMISLYYIKIKTAVSIFCACLFFGLNYYYYYYIRIPHLS